MIGRYFAAWFPLVVLAIANGTLREFGYKPLLGDLPAHWVSTVTFICFLGLYVWTIEKRWKPRSSREAWAIGVMWLAMTVTFEFGFGHYVMGHPWEKLLHDYNLLDGRVWILVLVATTVAPQFFFWVNISSSANQPDNV